MVISTELLKRYADRPLPRYTSYPTAPHFGDGFGDADYRAWLRTISADQPVSLYVHIPFCRAMCWYCGCNTSVTRRSDPVDRYLASLEREIDMVAHALPKPLEAAFVHFGGGTPTLIRPTQFEALMKKLRQRFLLRADAEVAVEIDPRTLKQDMVQALAAGGVNRASLGVQSFDPKVQRAINRVQTFDQTGTAVERLRACGIARINFDLIYGLPHQTLQSCIDTVAQAVTLRPDRLSVFGYAHVPGFKPHQRKIDEAALPGGAERHAQAQATAEALCAAGYVQIGLDHFALPNDALALSAAEGRLHRNFQGYTTDACDTLVGFGASSISRLPQGYVQNSPRVGDYQQLIAGGHLAAVKGRAFAGEDRLRATIIERIMCNYRADIAAICRRFGTDPEAIMSSAKSALEPLLTDGIAIRENDELRMPEDAKPLVRVLAAVFDQYLGRGPVRHSRAV
jgi:oxygen-independent coproporphyrinogen-3 oxidase